MMISPEQFREEHLNDSLKECYQIRREIIEDILRYENKSIPEEEYLIMSSQETIYHMNNLYLIEICKLIEEKQFDDENEEED